MKKTTIRVLGIALALAGLLTVTAYGVALVRNHLSGRADAPEQKGLQYGAAVDPCDAVRARTGQRPARPDEVLNEDCESAADLAPEPATPAAAPAPEKAAAEPAKTLERARLVVSTSRRYPPLPSSDSVQSEPVISEFQSMELCYAARNERIQILKDKVAAEGIQLRMDLDASSAAPIYATFTNRRGLEFKLGFRCEAIAPEPEKTVARAPAVVAEPAPILPREPFGLVLGNPLDITKPLGPFNMVVKTKDEGVGVTIYSDCSTTYESSLPRSAQIWVLNNCEFKGEYGWKNIPENRIDKPGTLNLFLAAFSDNRLMVVTYKLNPRVWEGISLASAEKLFIERYGAPNRKTPFTVDTLPLGRGDKIVTESGSWEWFNKDTFLRIEGDGDKLNSIYSYEVRIRDRALAAQAEVRIEAKDEKLSRLQQKKALDQENARRRSLQ